MLKISINDKFNSEVVENQGKILVNNEEINWDALQVTAREYHLIHQSSSISAELVSYDSETKTYKVKLNGKVFTAVVKDERDLLLEKLGVGSSSSNKLKNVKAPMPGLIKGISVKEGSAVQKGDVLFILEAMKMENSIKAAGAGVVKNIKVKQGESVEKNQLLVEFE